MVPGYVKLYRQLIDWEWYQDPNTMRLFIHCLIKANYEDKKWKGTLIEAGSFVTSSTVLSEELHLSRAQIRRSIFNLQNTKEIAIKTTNKTTIITVLNWATYQDIETNKTTIKKTIKQPTTQPTNNQQTTTTKNIRSKEYKEEVLKRSGETTRPTLQDIVDFISKKRVLVDGTQVPFVTDPEAYFNKRESVGWVTNGNIQIKDWAADLIAWEIREQEYKAEREIKKSGNGKIDKPDVKIEWLDKYISDQIS